MTTCPYCAADNFEYGTHCPFCLRESPPVYLGGQSRTPADIRDSGNTALVLTLVALVLLLILFCWPESGSIQ